MHYFAATFQVFQKQVCNEVARSILSTFLILLHNIWMLNWKCWIFYYFDTLLFRCCQPEWSKHDFEYWKEPILISNQKKLLFFGWWEIRMGFRSSYEVDGPCISLLDIYFVGRWSTTSHISFVTDLSVYSYGVESVKLKDTLFYYQIWFCNNLDISIIQLIMHWQYKCDKK